MRYKPDEENALKYTESICGYRWFKHPMECNSQAVTNPYLSGFKNQPHSNSYLLHTVNFAKHVLMKYLTHANFWTDLQQCVGGTSNNRHMMEERRKKKHGNQLPN